jgi:sugar lactone lactonase YvrE
MEKHLLILLAIYTGLYAGTASASTACPTPSLGISASSTLICSGTPVTFTALDSNAFSPSYQWYKNGVAVVGIDSIYIDGGLNNSDSVWVIMTSTCSGTFIDTSIHIIIAVNPTPSAPILSLSGGACLGSDSIGALVSGSATQINWYMSGSQVGTQSLGNDTPVTALACCAYAEGLYASGGYLYAASTSADAVFQYPTSVVNGSVGHIVAGGNGGGSAANQIENPRGLFMDRAGNLYVCDLNNDRIQMFPAGSDSLTNGVTVAGGNSYGFAANQLNSPIDVYVDSAGYIYVADLYNYRVQKFPPGSTSATNGLTVAGGNGNGTALNQINYPEGVFLDHAGNIYVADGGNNRILRFPPNSDSTTMGTVVAGGNGQGFALNQLYFPRGVALDAAGNIYVTDGGRIIVFPPGSTSATNGTVLAGMGARGVDDQFSTPIGKVVFDSSGSYMFVDDLLNYRTRRYGVRTYYSPPASGSYTATYTTTQGCVSGVSDTVTVYAPPVVTLGWDSLVQEQVLGTFGNDTVWGVVCFGFESPSVFPLAGGYPSGGIYSGALISNNTFNIQNWSRNTTEDTVYYTYTNISGCSATAIDSFEITDCDGIKTIPGEATITLYPNPNKGSFVLQSNDAVGKEYIITDMLGRVVAEQNITSNDQNIELQNISTGSYMLSVKGNNSKAVRFAVE